ncbi:GNAT family N-acetyltransferase [Vibrio sp. 10N.261.55.A7]|uniref:GNAT family N-acetyltransferase n=1 Tax=Vibrio sp. 10N.261.55.A7 TaxID=1880851 RepID=UPI000C866725|nr:GNAT family N-acetyltransferase [Vibrio sp. 10N.261.55.A7]PMJ92664.1 GNAT family N-acetyltransferase [Vibrio sp. 10N.261.55.A7]
MIVEITESDFRQFWPTFSEVIQAQETYAFDSNMTFEQAFELWCQTPLRTFAYIEDDEVLGSYYIKPNGMGPSNHICNCGYMVSSKARGKGVARKLCLHSQELASELGFKAMQFNSVVSSNKIAIGLWEKLGFSIIGTIPKAYNHAKLGYIDSYIMYKWLS